MTDPMEFFCTDGEWQAAERKERRLTLIYRILLILTPLVFIVLCLLVRTGNARVMHPVMLSVTGALGAAAIIVYLLFLRPTRQEKRHMDMLRNGEKEILEGRITVTGESFRIPKSVRVCRVILEEGEEPESTMPQRIEEEKRPALLSIDERWACRLPADGTKVRLATVHNYIAGMETTEAGAARPDVSRKVSPVRRFLRGASLVTAPLVMWAFGAVIFGSFIFYQITDTRPEKKICIYMDGEMTGEDQLAARLEKLLPEPIRMVKIHPFSYVMFGGSELKAGDLFLVPDGKLSNYADWMETGESWILYDPEGGTAIAADTFLYTADGTEDTWRLYIGAESVHREDGLAKEAAEQLIATEKKEETP